MAITGDNAQVDLNGALNVNLVANGDGIPQGATGLSISGNSAKVTMKGDVAIAGSLNNSSGLPLSLLGVSVSGDNNAVDIGGSVNISLDYTTPDSINAQAAGITVDGGNNTVTIAGGLNMNYADGRSSDRNGENDGLLAGVKVNGDNTLKIKGNSSFTMQGMPGDKATFAQVSGGGHLILEKDSTLGVSFTSVYRNDSGHQSVISATGEGSSADNYGIINSNAADTTLLQAASGAVVTNHGTITGKVSAQGGSWGIVESYAGSAAINASGGSINLTNSYTPEYGTALTDLPIRGHLRTSYAMLSGFSSTSSTLLNAEGGEINLQGAGLYGMGLTKGTGTNAGTINLDGFTPTFDDEGNVTDKEVWTGYIAARGAGIVTGSDEIGGASASATNTGTINVNNEGFGMLALNGGTVTNQGTINLTSDEGVERTTDNQLVGIGVIGGTAINDKTGVINIQGNVGQAFYNNGSGTIINYGQVCIDGTCQGPTDNNAEANNASRTQPDAPAGANNLQGYVVGTNTDGSAGKLMVSNASMQGVSVNTGFTSGTDATSVTFNDVVQGNNLTDATAIQSTSVVWNAKGSTDAAGNVDVTMTKKAYADAAGDSSVAGVAGALDAAYTNNALFNSLNVGTSAELSSALKQISGAGASSAGRDARILSNRFTMLADSAPQMPNGLSFNVVAKGDQRAELSNNTRYDMMALGQKFALGGNQTLSVQYGMARLDGNGARNAGDNGLTGGYSQFLGFDHALPLGDEGLMLNNSLRYDIHNLDTRRSISYGDVNATAKSGNREQYLELRSTAGKTLQWQEGLDVTPYAGLKLRHTLSDGYGEHGAGDFNLKMSNGSETALDSIAGVKLSYAGKDGWAVTASLEGGPNLSYAQSQRKASLQGAAGQSFNVNSGEKGGGFNGQATLGVKYNGKAGALQLDAFQWKEDGISDKGLMFNLKKTF
ncbi:autotransporter outer membrane beta-barrel domain-containing protein [Enterobacillus tribolii]|nr:autotransporter outer membrane beta-barrel domain-containing protein [Enterobacillus tribolii]